MSTLFEFPLPDIGEGVAEGEIVQWMVKEGDQVKEDQEIVEVMTDKATVPITSPVSGKVVKLSHAAGDVVPVGSVLLAIEPTAGTHVPTVVAHGSGGHGGSEKKAAPAAAPAKAAPAAAAAEPEFARPKGERALATPYTRKLAREAGVDIEKIRGTGEVGRVTPEDVQRFVSGGKGGGTAADGIPHATPAKIASVAAATPAEAAVAAGEDLLGAAPSLSEQVAAKKPAPAAAPARVYAPGSREETRVPIRGLRKKISERMHQSKSTAAHFTYVDEFDATPLVALRNELKESAKERGAKLTYLPFILKAIVSAMRAFPTMNGITDDAKQEFVVKHYFNFGIAVDTEDGLIVPVVKDVDHKSLLQIAQEIERISTDARNGKIKADDLKDGTFTVTNAGNIGGLFATPVINYPEAAILGVHAIKRKPWLVGDKVEARDIMYLSVSIDHRMNDGATGARWMNHVLALLADPKRLMLEL